jgi:shikimate kinase
MNLKLKRTPGIYLIGFMGSGKSTVGRMLAEEIGWRFADLDDDIEKQQRRSVSEIFSTSGEEEFRRVEHEALARRVRSVRCGAPTVLALGGGAFTRDENINLLTDNGVTIWIDATFAIVKSRVGQCEHRPLARDPVRFEQLYRSRRQSYSKAEFRVEVKEDNSRKVVAELLKLPLFD